MSVAYKNTAVIDAYQRWIVTTWIEPLTGEDVYTVTRGHSTPIQQLATIADYAAQAEIAFKEFRPHDVLARVQITYEGKELEAYAWWQTWVELLRQGYVVNPPLAAIIPFAFGAHSTGDVIYASPHVKLMPSEEDIKMLRFDPCPLDFSQRVNRELFNERVDIDGVAELMEKAKAEGAPIRNIKPEPKNGCVHIDLARVSMS